MSQITKLVTNKKEMATTFFIFFLNVSQFSKDNWKLQIVEIFHIENIIQFNFFSTNQLSKLIKSFFYNYLLKLHNHFQICRISKLQTSI